MPPNPIDRTLFRVYNYTAPDGSVEEIRMSQEIGDAVGNPPAGTRIEYSINHKRLRLLNLRYQDDPAAKVYRKRVVCCNETNPLFTGAANTVDIAGSTWTVTSRTPHKFR